MSACCAIKCSNRPEKSSKKTFHKFPLSKPELYQQWVINLRRDKWKPSSGSRLLSDHFTESCFDRTGTRTRLVPDAVPTVFSFPEHLAKACASHECTRRKLQRGSRSPRKRREDSGTPPVHVASSNCATPPQDTSDDATEPNYAVFDTPRALKRKLEACATAATSAKKRMKLHDAGVVVTSLTSDGLRWNFTMFKELGAVTDDESTFPPWFPHPVKQDRIYSPPLRYLLTYKLSQDHIELFSLTSCLGKLYERTVTKRIQQHPENKRLYPDTMFSALW
ncbi:uncharacterized protein LOC144102508 [Amblyomma americanum]